MDTVDLVRPVAALAVVLGLIGLAGFVARRWGPASLFNTAAAPRRDRRMKVVETLMLDPQRRLVLVSLDGSEHLLLLGEGRLLSKTMGASPDPRPQAPETVA